MLQQPVWEYLSGAKAMLSFADAQTRDLDRLTFRLSDPAATTRRKDEVWRTYLEWLVFARQAAVSIDKAGKAADSPAQFTSWWDGRSDDPGHAFFRAERNAALKEVADAIVVRPITDGLGTSLAHWAFPQDRTQETHWSLDASGTTIGFTVTCGPRLANCSSRGL